MVSPWLAEWRPPLGKISATWNPPILSLPLRRSHVIVTTVVVAAPVRPSVARPFPVIVYIHGAPQNSLDRESRAAEWHVTRRRPRTTAHVVRRTRPAVVVL